MDIQQRIQDLEKEIRETPYHKGTEHHIGLLRARIARLKDELVEQQIKRRGGRRSAGTSGPEGGFYAIKKAGDATVVLVGPPSVGKSTLLNALTNARSPVAPYMFTTVTVIPGMMDYQGAHIQILDVPGLIEGASHGKGRGKEVLSVVRGADLIIFVTEVGKEDAFEEMEAELYQAGVRINIKPPQVRIDKKVSGGLVVRTLVKQTLGVDTIKDVAQEFKLKNAEVTIKEQLKLERLIDAFAANRVYVDALYVVNKVDLSTSKVERRLHLRGAALSVSARDGDGIEELKQAIWDKLGFVRVYLAKPPAKPDFHSPLIMRPGGTLEDVAAKVGMEFATRVKGARISGPGSKFPLQEVQLGTSVVDEMEVTFET